MERLPTELLPLIEQHLERRDLYHCVQANHLFYGLMTPFLWHTVKITSAQRVEQFLHIVTNTTDRSFILGQSIHTLHLTLTDGENGDRDVLRGFPYWTIDRTTTLDKSTIDNGLKWIATHCPQLVSMTLGRMQMSRSTFVTFGQHSHQLSCLTLRYCSPLPYDLATLFTHLPLKELTIATTDHPYYYWPDDEDNNDAPPHKDEFVILDLTGFQHLTRLRLSGDMTNHLLEMVLFNIRNHDASFVLWPHLTWLSLDSCVEIEDDHLITMLHSLPLLTRLDAIHIFVTDALLVAVATFQSGIVELDLSCCNLLTTLGIRHLIHRCHDLVFIKLANCGMTMDDFPEANASCAGMVVKRNDRVIAGLKCLDEETIEKIRLVPEPEPDPGDLDDKLENIDDIDDFFAERWWWW